jgi:hypothetical protein
MDRYFHAPILSVGHNAKGDVLTCRICEAGATLDGSGILQLPERLTRL